ncbi:unnamed protein product, partial [Meganyctiphanes norvegica]
RLKVFKASNDSDIRMVIKKFEGELETLKQMVGIVDDLTDVEYVPIFRATLDFTVLERVEQVFKKDIGNIKTWGSITVKDLHKLMIEEFGVKHTDVANVLKQFGPSRLIKSSDKAVQDFYFEWSQNIPEIMKPSTDQEYKDFADLIHRAMYYISLNDTHLQQALSDLKTPNPTLKTYFDETIAAESRRKCFQDIATTSSTLDSKGVTISKWDASYLQKQTGKDTTAFKSVKPKGKLNSENSENTQGKNSKWGNKGQKQNSNQNSDQKSNQNSTQNSTQNSNRKPNAKKGRYCTNCKTKTHDTDYCWHLKNGKSKQKHINSLDASNDSQEDQDQNDFDFGKFNALCAVDHKSPVIDSFATKLASHPLATTESLMTKLNLEG